MIVYISVYMLVFLSISRAALQWEPVPEKYDNSVTEMKERLQQFLFPQEKSQSGRLRRINTHGVNKREGNYNKLNLQKDDNLEVDNNRDKRSINSDQLYVLAPFQKVLKKYRSTLDQKNAAISNRTAIKCNASKHGVHNLLLYNTETPIKVNQRKSDSDNLKLWMPSVVTPNSYKIRLDQLSSVTDVHCTTLESLCTLILTTPDCSETESPDRDSSERTEFSTLNANSIRPKTEYTPLLDKFQTVPETKQSSSDGNYIESATVQTLPDAGFTELTTERTSPDEQQTQFPRKTVQSPSLMALIKPSELYNPIFDYNIPFRTVQKTGSFNSDQFVPSDYVYFNMSLNKNLPIKRQNLYVINPMYSIFSSEDINQILQVARNNNLRKIQKILKNSELLTYGPKLAMKTVETATVQITTSKEINEHSSRNYSFYNYQKKSY